MRRACLLALLFLTVPQVIWAASETIQFGGFGGLSIGAFYEDMGDLNDWLKPTGADLPNAFPQIGAHGYAILFERLMLGGRAIITQATANGTLTDVDLYLAQGQGEVGFAVVNSQYGLAFPFIGLGVNTVDIRFKEGDDPTVWKYYRANDEVIRNTLYGTAGFAYHYPLKFLRNTDGGFGMFLGGVHAGATFPLESKSWEDGEGNELQGGPDLPFTTFFFQVDLSFGGGTLSNE